MSDQIKFYKYDAFISYNQKMDKPFVRRLQTALQSLGKAWWQRRAIRIFRDETSLSATPKLWPSIEAALKNSRYLVVCASPEAASSIWVDKEVSWWLKNKGQNTLLIALTAGELKWDRETNDFLWTESTPLPPAFKGALEHEPKWIDFRDYRFAEGGENFIAAAADLSAAIQGISKEDLLSEEVRQQRRALRTAYAGAFSFAVIACFAGWLAYLAYKNGFEAAQQRDSARLSQKVAEEQRELAQVEQKKSFADLAKLMSFRGYEFSNAGDFETPLKISRSLLPSWESNSLRPYVSSLEALSTVALNGRTLRWTFASSGNVAAVDDDPSSEMIAMVGEDIVVIKRGSLDPARRMRLALDAEIEEIKCLSFCKSIVGFTRTGEIFLVDTELEKLVWKNRVDDRLDRNASHIVLTKAQDKLAIAAGPTIYILDTASGDVLQRLDTGIKWAPLLAVLTLSTSTKISLAFSGDGKYLVAGYNDGVKLIDTSNFALVAQVALASSGESKVRMIVRNVSISAKGGIRVLASEGNGFSSASHFFSYSTPDLRQTHAQKLAFSGKVYFSDSDESFVIDDRVRRVLVLYDPEKISDAIASIKTDFSDLDYVSIRLEKGFISVVSPARIGQTRGSSLRVYNDKGDLVLRAADLFSEIAFSSYSSDTLTAITVHRNGTVRSWQSQTMPPKRATFHFSPAGHLVAKSPDGSRVLVRDGDTAWILNASGEILTQKKLPPSMCFDYLAAVSDDFRHFAVACKRKLFLWATGPDEGDVLTELSASITAIAHLGDGKIFVSFDTKDAAIFTSQHGSLNVVASSALACSRVISVSSLQSVACLTVDDRILLINSNGVIARELPLAPKKADSKFRTASASLALTSDQKLLAVLRDDSHFFLIDLHDMRELRHLELVDHFDPEEFVVLARALGGSVDYRKLKERGGIDLRIQFPCLPNFAHNSDSTVWVVYSCAKSVIINSKTGKFAHLFTPKEQSHPVEVQYVTFSDHDRRLIVVGAKEVYIRQVSYTNDGGVNLDPLLKWNISDGSLYRAPIVAGFKQDGTLWTLNGDGDVYDFPIFISPQQWSSYFMQHVSPLSADEKRTLELTISDF